MKKISLLVVLASISLAISPAIAQTPDTTKNKVEIKKKTKVGVNGRQVTKIKMESKGTPEAVTGAVENAVTGKAATPATPATPAQPSSPNVVVVNPEPVTKVVTVPVAVKPTNTSSRTVTTNVRTSTSKRPVARKTYSKPVSASTSTTTTTTVKKD